jgi:hypothetical protein
MRSRLAFSTGRIVQREVADDDVAVDPDAHLQGHPLLDGVVPRDDALDRRPDVVGLGFGKESDAAEVHTEQRHADRSRELGCA